MWVLVYLSFLILVIASILIDKKLSKIEIYATSFFAFSYGITTDSILDLNYDLYGYFEKGFDLLGLLAIFLYFPSISILFLNLYPYKNKFKIKLLYILGWTVFSVIFELFCLQTNFFYYNGWKLWYSVIVYPLIFLILLVNLKLVRKIIKQSNHKEN